ncbi:CAMK family protein kinase [Tritrichomonas foetus]|uniref:non-specific serine/threonine protein kinase n=1 Tax=Tritrichomonas foetus TaxID=1144522 RepID=A0A1J4KEC5_9EUKA|nr:CAMK family protein kinase [Tritrichomonas foetus]|eukprot:OHT09783.1 CAMK family protein kinase [Tritrichomonas foetus]
MGDEVEAPQNIGPYILLEKVGSGAFATVYKALHSVTNITVALKVIAKKNLKNQNEFQLLQREVNLMKSMDHPFIASFYEVRTDDKNFYIAIEFVENGNLLDYVNNQRGLSEAQAKKIFYQLVSVLDYLHTEKHVAHRDLKAENVLLDRNFNIRLCDFGLSKAFSTDDPFLKTTCGSPAYVAPEVIKEKPYTSAADIWSAGVLLYAMVCATLPFNGDNITLMLQQIIRWNPPIPNSLSPELRALITRILIKEPRSRITINEIKGHPWLAEYEDSRLTSEDSGLLGSLKVMEVQALDTGVMSEMRIIGYDTGGLLQEVNSYQVTERTAAYKILKREKTIDEINAWQKSREMRCKQLQNTRLPMLYENAHSKSVDGRAQNGHNKNLFNKFEPGGKFRTIQTRVRKKVNEPKNPIILTPI